MTRKNDCRNLEKRYATFENQTAGRLEPMTSPRTTSAGAVEESERGRIARTAAPPVCPACGETTREPVVETFGRYELFGCAACGLQFWEPREMPDARWFEHIYGGR